MKAAANPSPKSPAADDASALRAMMELEKNTTSAIRKERADTRLTGSFPALVEPGNASDRGAQAIKSICKDMSQTGCRLVCNKALTVGDIFLITVQNDKLRVPRVFARCIRCSLLSETAFECGLSFFTDVDLPRVEAENESLI